MSNMTWTNALADLFGLGGSDVRRCTELDSRNRIGISPAPRVAPFQGTGAPTGAVLVGTVPAGSVLAGSPLADAAPFAHNSIGTTLGIHPSRRPQS